MRIHLRLFNARLHTKQSGSQLCGCTFVIEELEESQIQPDVDLHLTSRMITGLQANGVLSSPE